MRLAMRITAGRLVNLLQVIALPLLLAAPALGQDMRSFTDDLGRNVQVPVAPKRIVTLWDAFLTVPLLELGVIPVGSQGRGTSEDAAYIRGGRLMTGVDFAPDGIRWVGDWPVDIERIAALSPDLIITAPWMELDPDVLQAIAPTVSLDPSAQPLEETFAELADLTGTEDRLSALQSGWEAQLARLKALVPPGLTVSTLYFAGDGQVHADPAYGAVARILKEIGLSQPAAIESLSGDTALSPEIVGQMDADVILSVVYTDQGLSPADHLAWAEAAVPGFCDRMTACAEGHMFFVPIDETYAASYTAMGRVAMAMAVILSQPELADQ